MVSHICTGIYVCYLIFIPALMYRISYLYWYLSTVSHICTDIYVWYLIFVLVFMYGISYLYLYLCMVSHICIGIMYGRECFCVCGFCCCCVCVFWHLSCKPPTELSACLPSQAMWLRSARRACPCGPRPTTLPSLTATSPSTTWLRTQSMNSASLPQTLLAPVNSVCPVLQSKSKRSLVSEMVVHASVCLPWWGLPPLVVFASLRGLNAFLLI